MNKPKILGKVDLSTGIAYDNNGNVMPKENFTASDDLQERLKRRRAWLAGEFSYTDHCEY